MQVWILTFRRPKALNRQIAMFGSMGYDVHIFSNHPVVDVFEENKQYVKGILINTLGDPDCTAWMARSWNSVYLKCFKLEEEAMFVQDDTPVRPELRDLIEYNKDKYDLIWGPQGDAFYYLKKRLISKIGWWDERYLGAYCADADFLMRCWLYYDRDRLSISESHDWGMYHNSIGLEHVISTEYMKRIVDEDYLNQHDQIAQIIGWNESHPMLHSQKFFRNKWHTPGNGLNEIGPLINHISHPIIEDIDWYPWFTKMYLQNKEG